MSLYIKQIQVGSNSITVNLGAEELFIPPRKMFDIWDTDCPGPDRCDPSDPTEDCPPPPPPPERPTFTDSNWYSEDCDECCHPVSDKIINYMEIVVATFKSPGYTENITSEGADVDAIVDAGVADGECCSFTIDPREHSAGTLSRTRIKTKPDGTKVYDLDYSANCPVEQDLEHLEVVIYKKIDFDRMQNDFDTTTAVSLQSSIKRRMGSQVIQEMVIEGGQTVQDSHVIKTRDTGVIWTGSVHNHPSKGLMGGAIHSMLPHPALVRERVLNTKIKDDRVKDRILSLDLGGALTATPDKLFDVLNTSSDRKQINLGFISDPIMSRAPDGKTRFLFYIDYASLVKAESRFPGLQNNAVYGSAPIESIQIFRQRATSNKGKTEFGIDKVSDASWENQSLDRRLVVASSDRKLYSSSESMQYSSPPQTYAGGLKRNSRNIDKNFDGVEETTTGTIEEVQITNLTDNGLRVFSVTDDEIADFTSGKYRYTAEIQVKDPTLTYLNQRLSKMCFVKDKLSDLSAHISGQPVYDSINKRFVNSYQQSSGARHTLVTKQAIAEVMSLVKLATGRVDRSILNYLAISSSVQTGSPAGVETLIEVMNAYEEKLLSVLGSAVGAENSHNAKIENATGIIGKSNPDSNIINIEKDFDFIVDRSIHDDVGIDYTRANLRNFPRMTDREFANRIREEKKKFYSSSKPSTKPGKQVQDLMAQTSLSRKTINALRSSGTDYSYLTPARITTGDVQMDLIGDRSEIDNAEKYNKINLYIAEAMSPPGTGPTHTGTFSEMSQEMLQDLGVSVNFDDYETDVFENYTDDTTNIFGNKSFGSNNIEQQFEDTVLRPDSFGASVIQDLATSVLDLATTVGSLNANSAYNQDQEIRAKDNIADMSDNLTIEKFDISREDNILVDLTPSKIRKMPMGVRSLFLSRSKARLNWVDHPRDIFRDSKIKNIYRYNQGKTAKVEYLAGHRETNAGKSPKMQVYSLLTAKVLDNLGPGQTILARIRPETIKEYAIGTDLSADIGIYGENFLITKRGTPARTRVTQASPYTPAQAARAARTLRQASPLQGSSASTVSDPNVILAGMPSEDIPAAGMPIVSPDTDMQGPAISLGMPGPALVGVGPLSKKKAVVTDDKKVVIWTDDMIHSAEDRPILSIVNETVDTVIVSNPGLSLEDYGSRPVSISPGLTPVPGIDRDVVAGITTGTRLPIKATATQPFAKTPTGRPFIGSLDIRPLILTETPPSTAFSVRVPRSPSLSAVQVAAQTAREATKTTIKTKVLKSKTKTLTKSSVSKSKGYK